MAILCQQNLNTMKYEEKYNINSLWILSVKERKKKIEKIRRMNGIKESKEKSRKSKP